MNSVSHKCIPQAPSDLLCIAMNSHLTHESVSNGALLADIGSLLETASRVSTPVSMIDNRLVFTVERGHEHYRGRA